MAFLMLYIGCGLAIEKASKKETTRLNMANSSDRSPSIPSPQLHPSRSNH
ncbi:MAG: hypothetical protein V7K48_02390 [Nostoc sp.]